MTNVRLHIAYDGTDYHGWQKQHDVTTIEGEILKVLDKMLAGNSYTFQGASRTDAGVHAEGQVANVKFDIDRTPWDFVRSLNSMLPPAIAVNHAEVVPDEFNARFDARGKTYRYKIWNHRFPHPLEDRFSWHVRYPINIEKFRAATLPVVGEHDFAGFRAADCQAKSTVREITRVEVFEDGNFIIIEVDGTAFLKYMVRTLVGSFAEVGFGQMTVANIEEALSTGDRTKAGRTGASRGLRLIEVRYPDYPWSTSPTIGLDYRWNED